MDKTRLNPLLYLAIILIFNILGCQEDEKSNNSKSELGDTNTSVIQKDTLKLPKNKQDSSKMEMGKINKLFAKRDYQTILQKADSLSTAGFRTRADAYELLGDFNKALNEYNLKTLKLKGYPNNLQSNYYLGWNSISVKGKNLLIENTEGNLLNRINIENLLGKDPSKIWTDKEQEKLTNEIKVYEAKHPYCCLTKFLINGYAPTDIERIASLNLVLGNYNEANLQLNLLRLLDWEASFSEVELLSIYSCVLQGKYQDARKFIDTTKNNVIGWNSLRYSKHDNLFLELVANYDTDRFKTLSKAFEIEFEKSKKSENDFFDSFYNQPVLELWLSKLPDNEKTSKLRQFWYMLKQQYHMEDIYTFMMKKE